MSKNPGFTLNFMDIRRNKEGFSLGIAMTILLITSFVIVASITLISSKQDEFTNTSRYAKVCITDEGAASLTSEACAGAIQGCKTGIEKDCNTIFYFVDTNTAEVHKLAKEICDEGGEKACKFLMDRCIDSYDNCDIAATDNDLNYYLNLVYTDSNSGRAYIESLGTAYYKQTIVDVSSNTNFNYAVETVCDAEIAATKTFNSTACRIMGYETATYFYTFDTSERSFFSEENSIIGTTFSSSAVTLLPPEEYQLQYGGSSSDRGYSLVLSGGYIYVVGYEQSDSGGGDYDILVMKLNDADGTVVWKNQYGGSSSDYGYSIAVSGGYIYVTGWEQSDSSGGGSDIFVLKLNDSDGSVVWKNQYGGSGSDYGNSIAVSGGYIYVTGNERSDSGGGDTDIFVMKLNDADGSVVWNNQYGGSGSDRGLSLIVSEGYIYVTGYENSDSNGGNYDIAVLKLNDSDGSVAWKNQYGGTNADAVQTLAVSGGYIYVTGYEESDSGGGNADIMVLKLNEADGTVVWKNQYGGDSYDYGKSLTVSGGYIYVTGYEQSDSSGGGVDIYVMKLNDSDGSVAWKNQYGGSSSDYGYSIAVSGGYIYVTGWEQSDSDGGSYDIVVMKLSEDQASSNITGWTVEGPVSWGLIDNLDGWTVEGAVSWGLIDNLDGWTVEDAITGWSLEGTSPLDDEIIDEWTVGDFPDRSYYVQTTDMNQVQDVKIVTSAVISQVTPGSTVIRWLVSFDGRNQWKKWNGSSWANATTDLSTYDFSDGNTYDEIETGLTDYILTGGDDSADFAINLEATHAELSAGNIPTVGNLQIEYIPVP